MWVTQTYLGTVEPDAKLFVYYLFEDYNPDQAAFTKEVEIAMGALGESYGNKVSLLMPNPLYAGRIEAEMRQHDWVWFSFSDHLPGLFISQKPITKLERNDDDFVFIPFNGQTAEDVALVIQKVRSVANNTLNWDFSNPHQQADNTIWKRVLDALELKPGIGPLKIDVRKLFAK